MLSSGVQYKLWELRIHKYGSESARAWDGCENIIIDLIQSGHLHQKISDILKISKLTDINVLGTFFATGSVENKPRSGRPAKMKERDYCGLERFVKTHYRESIKI